MKEIWIDSKKAAELIGVDRSLIQKRVKAGKTKLIYKYVDGCGKRGKKIEILLSSLPDEAIARYHHLVPANNAWDELKPFTGKQREGADRKAYILELCHDRGRGMTVEAFAEWYNREYDDNITPAQIFRWQKKMKSGGPAALVDRRGRPNKGQSTIPDDAWDYFYSLYMRQQKPGVQLCYDYTKIKYPDIPSVYAFRRKVKTIDAYTLIYYREGEQAFRDSFPSEDRDKTDIQSNDIWFSDHHRMDVFTKNKDGSKVCRMWLTVFFDARSNKVISYLCRNADPNATAIKQTLQKGIEQCGVPKEVYFDNGKDYRSKAFQKDFPWSISRQIGINNIYATPYHGQAKTVERFFRTLEERFGKMFPTYAGKDAKNRPEQMRIPNEKILVIAPDEETFLKCLDHYMEDYNNTPSKGKDLDGKSPEKVYWQNLLNKKEVADKEALAILCGTFDRRTVHKNGITYNGREYWSEKLLPCFKQQVIINYVPENMDELNVFDEEMNPICKAAAKIRTPFRHTTEEDYKEAEKKKKAVRKIVRKMKPVQDVDTMSLIAEKQLREKAYQEISKEPAAAEQITLPLSMPPKEPQPVSKRIDRKEPSFDEILMKKYENVIGG